MTVEAAFYDRDMRLTGLVSHSSTFGKVLFLDVYVYMYIAVVVSAQSLRMCCAFKSRNTLSESNCHHSTSLSSFSWFYHALLFLVSGPELLYLIQIAQKQTQQLTARTKLGCFSTFPFAASFFFAGFVLFFFCCCWLLRRSGFLFREIKKKTALRVHARCGVVSLLDSSRHAGARR